MSKKKLKESLQKYWGPDTAGAPHLPHRRQYRSWGEHLIGQKKNGVWWESAFSPVCLLWHSPVLIDHASCPPGRPGRWETGAGGQMPPFRPWKNFPEMRWFKFSKDNPVELSTQLPFVGQFNTIPPSLTSVLPHSPGHSPCPSLLLQWNSSTASLSSVLWVTKLRQHPRPSSSMCPVQSHCRFSTPPPPLTATS